MRKGGELHRESNFELLRIVAMMFIIMHHELIAAGLTNYVLPSAGWGNILNAFLVCGVNCFILISGFFGIHLSLRKMLHFLFLIAVTALFDVMLSFVGGESGIFYLRYALHKIIPFFPDSNWFIPCYAGLMLASPLLNKALSAASFSEKRTWTLLLTALNLYAYFFSVGAVNSAGYTLIQFIYLYVLGHFFRSVRRKPGAAQSLLLYIAGSATAALVATYFRAGYTAFAYNSPQILLSSAGLFLFFSSLRLRSRAVNGVARCMFCVFLFHYLMIYGLKDGCSAAEAIGIYIGAFAGGCAVNLIASFLWNLIMRMAGERRTA